MLQYLKKILTPIDFSEYSVRAMDRAYELAKETGAEFHLIHVVAPHHNYLLLPLAADAERAREMAREAGMVEQAEEELERLKKDHLENSKKVKVVSLVGHPVAKIAEYAKEQGIDLILMATHGRTGLEHMMIGSVAEKLVRTAPCSVLVLRTERGAQS